MNDRREPPAWLHSWSARLQSETGPRYWRSLDELAGTQEFQRWVRDEFPAGPWGGRNDLLRRDFLKLMAASLALAGLAGCGNGGPPDAIVPYVRQPEDVVPGRPTFYASTLVRGGYGTGVVVETHTGRPTKIEGNPAHPASLGATSVFEQAEVLALYDPDRSRGVHGPDGIATWQIFSERLAARLAPLRDRRGRGLHLLTGHVTSPTLLAELARVLDAFPGARWHVHEPIGLDRARAGLRRATGGPLEPVYRFGRARVTVALDSDFLFTLPGAVRYARDFTRSRHVRPGADVPPSRLYVAEPSPTITGGVADHRLALSRGLVPALAAALAAELGLPAAREGGGDPRRALPEPARRWLKAAADDLRQHRGASLVVAGLAAPPAVHALVHALNAHLGNVGATVRYRVPDPEAAGLAPGTLDELTGALEAGAVTDLVILDANPVYTASDGGRFATALDGAEFRVHAGSHRDETARRCTWHLPSLHPLEDWGDARAHDGTVGLIQPVIRPVYGGRSLLAILPWWRGETLLRAADAVQAHWREHGGAGDFATWWRAALHDGLVRDSAAATVTPGGNAGAAGQAWRDCAAAPPDRDAAGGLELAVQPHARVWDGRFANVAWLLELPEPLTTVTWTNAAWLAPALADRLGVRDGDVVRLRRGDREVLAPAAVVPGQAETTVGLCLGWGRTAAGRLGDGLGADVGRLRGAESTWTVTGIEIEKTGERHELARVQNHHSMEGRHLLREGTFAEFRRDPHQLAHPRGEKDPESLYPPRPYDGQQWGMAIDLSACFGCGACTIACQAENNIPVVGEQQVRNGREMHWIRIDRYFAGSPAAPDIRFQPVPCMQCEDAPCEVVCPVGATQHSGDGLNEMLYNRCIGTRYCSNNCPYKVRRFNFYRFIDPDDLAAQLPRNPDVTVRGRGVMEKCTYCVQRIRGAERDARREQRQIRDGEIVTACQAVCPAEAIVFGDIADPDTQVSRWKREPHDYTMLEEVNTRPRTTYLALVRDPNPELARGTVGREDRS